MANYTIKDLENFTGIKAHTIRIWEKRYNVVEPKRTDTNIRYYDDEDLKKLLNVSILNRQGYKISSIANLSNQMICEKVLNLAHTSNDVENQIESLVLAMIDLDEQKFDKVFNTAVLNMGFEETILRLVYPFFRKIGLLWLIGTINPAQEHFISNLIRQKLIVAIEGVIEQPAANSKNFLLFLPEGEYHELGLLFYYYILKKHNHKVFYLGESVPFDAISETSKLKRFDAVLTSIVTSRTRDEVTEYLNRLSAQFKGINVYIAGQLHELNNLSIPKNIYLIENASEFKNELNRI